MIVVLILQIIVAVLLILSVLLQMQGGGLSSAFGGGGEVYRSRRSIEKFLFTGTIILAALFGLFSLILLIPR